MDITLNKSGQLAIVLVGGRMDTLSAPEFEKKMQEWIGQGETRFVVDFHNLDYISSAGLRSLMVVAKDARARGGELVCCALKGVVKQVFDVSGFSALLPVYGSMDDATKGG
ncbi:MAG: STAS domain-containing protein [Deltaproteobacteria bacterium]|nr:STAS domain-containing protein [Deltaproteobacteria bacterium]